MYKELIQIEKLEILIKQIKDLKLDSYNEEKILKVMEFEKDLILRKFVEQLGQEQLQKIKKQGAQNGR